MSRHHRKQKWTTHAPKLRAQHEATLPRPCIECGGVITKGTTWHVGHVVAAMLPGSTPTFANTGPVHPRCNLRSGGRMGAAVTNSRRRQASGRLSW